MGFKHLEDIVNLNETRKAALVDIVSNISYTTVVGTVLDTFSGLGISGVIAARVSSLGTNALTAAPYGWWTEKVYTFTNTNKDSHSIRKRFVDLLSFNTFQLPVYAVVLSIGTYFSEGEVNFDKVKNGVENLAIFSPFIGPTLGWYMSRCRRLFDVKTLDEGVYKKN